MRTYDVALDAKAIADLKALYDYIAARTGPDVALKYIHRIETKCLSLRSAPKRGTKREDLGPGFRTIGFEKRVTILFSVEEDIARVEILSVFYGGREVAP